MGVPFWTLGNGGADVLRGGEGDDILAVSDLNFSRIVGGSGTDTLRLDATGLVLDLTTTPDNRIVDIEQIDITGLSPNTLTLDLQEVLNISSHSNTLVVMGDGDDTVNIGASWFKAGTELIGSDTFDVYTQGQATLKVAQAASIIGSADFDANGFVDGFDFLAWQRGFGATGGATLSDGDANYDQDVDSIDLSMWSDQFGQVASPLAASASAAVSTSAALDILSSVVATTSVLPSTELEKAIASNTSALATPASSTSSPQRINTARLVDAAIAVAVADLSPAREDDALVVGDLFLEYFPTYSADEAANVGSPFDRLSDGELPKSVISDKDSVADAKLGEETLDEVFARFFG